jgi:hypothetical protein
MTTIIEPKIQELEEMFDYKRPAKSESEEKFCKKFIANIPGIIRDGYGNYILRVGKKEQSKSLFLAHTDTVHNGDGKQNTLYIEKERKRFAYTDETDCLGADNATGVWLIEHMIKNQVPGLYIFCREHEIGYLGTNYILQNTPNIVKGIERVFSFDRKGYSSIITKQMRATCCSDEFAEALAKELNKNATLMYQSDPTGVSTDSACYISTVSECTNLSVGFFNEHQVDEIQNLSFAEKLARQLPQVDWESLPTIRNPKDYKLSRRFASNNESDGFYQLYKLYGGFQ